MYRSVMLMIALGFGVTGTVGAQIPADLQKAMDERSTAVDKVDSATWDRLTMDDFTIINENGRLLTKTQRLALFRTAAPRAATRPTEEHVTHHGDVYIRWALYDNIWVTDVWVKDARGWRATAVREVTVQK